MEVLIPLMCLSWLCLILIPSGGISRPIPIQSTAVDPVPDPAGGGETSEEYKYEYNYVDETTVAGTESGKRRVEAGGTSAQWTPKPDPLGSEAKAKFLGRIPTPKNSKSVDSPSSELHRE
jgi:hypothetical protein